MFFVMKSLISMFCRRLLFSVSATMCFLPDFVDASPKPPHEFSKSKSGRIFFCSSVRNRVLLVVPATPSVLMRQVSPRQNASTLLFWLNENVLLAHQAGIGYYYDKVFQGEVMHEVINDGYHRIALILAAAKNME